MQNCLDILAIVVREENETIYILENVKISTFAKYVIDFVHTKNHVK